MRLGHIFMLLILKHVLKKNKKLKLKLKIYAYLFNYFVLLFSCRIVIVLRYRFCFICVSFLCKQVVHYNIMFHLVAK